MSITFSGVRLSGNIVLPHGSGGGNAPPPKGSVLFNSTNYLTVPPSPSIGFGTEDFTVECWAYKNSDSPGEQGLFGLWNNPENFFCMVGSDLGPYAFINVKSQNILRGSNAVTPGQWFHYAATRRGTTLNLFINGIKLGSTTSDRDVNYQSGTNIMHIGTQGNALSRAFNGYISNLRIIKGTAYYDDNGFTVPTSPLTAVPNTVLLTCQSPTEIKDASTNNFSITNVNSAQPSSFNPFN